MKPWLKLLTVLSLLCALTVSTKADTREPFVLPQNEKDALCGVYFFGESTTAHLARVGGVLEGREKVVRDESGTRYLDMRILSSPVIYEGEKLALADAVERAQPRVLVLSFGLNGLSRWSRDPEAFLRNYRALIDGILARSPKTKIILQSVYPVGENDCFSAPVHTLNAQIVTLNGYISSLSHEYKNVDYINTAAFLSDASGALSSAYDVGDGIHLTNEAYRIILSHLCQTMGGRE